MTSHRHALFVYGTLKRGGSNHSVLAGQQFVALARTAPGFCLVELDGYPGLVADPMDRAGVTGELWMVDAACLAELDRLEGLDEGLYRRATIPLASPLHDQIAPEAYFYARSVAGRRRLGATWNTT